MSTSGPDVSPTAGEAVDVHLAVAGDTRAFERLYRVHAARIHSLARRMGGDQEADELTQEVFVRAWQGLGGFRGDAAFGTWLHRVAVNVIMTRRAAHAVRRTRMVEGDDPFAALPAPAGGREHRVDLERAIQRLPEGARRVLVLHDVEGYKHEEIAGALGVTVGTSKAQLHRARLLLRDHLSGGSR
jgi:RNA polymerase sigma-70 factor (ECF subfamily)